MKEIISNSLLPRSEERDSLTRLGRRAAIVLGTLCLSGLLSALEVTQAEPVTRAPLADEILAIHRAAKRPVAEATTMVESFTEVAINSAQGPGPVRLPLPLRPALPVRLGRRLGRL